jgi:hypothetical protein
MRGFFLVTFCLLLLTATGCPTAGEHSGPVDTCTEAGQQCRLGGGKLGVCTMDTAGNLQCASQH